MIVVVDDDKQFSVQGGGAGGDGTSPASAIPDRLTASRERAISLFIDYTPVS